MNYYQNKEEFIEGVLAKLKPQEQVQFVGNIRKVIEQSMGKGYSGDHSDFAAIQENGYSVSASGGNSLTIVQYIPILIHKE